MEFRNWNFQLLLVLLVGFAACKEEAVLVPKPRIYPKVIYPEKAYEPLEIEDCPFTMEVPKYFQYIKDKDQNAVEKKHNCWFDLYCQELNSYIHLSYLPFSSRKEFDKLIGDAFEMADKHNIKASYRNELKITKPEEQVHGLIFEIDGPVATPLQFFMTDSTRHFIRGSLYFKSSVNRDSIAPVYDFHKLDVGKMVESFEWR